MIRSLKPLLFRAHVRCEVASREISTAIVQGESRIEALGREIHNLDGRRFESLRQLVCNGEGE